jgi:hypothetical protein
MIIYIVEAFRWGDKENHSYVIGCWDNIELAKKAAIEHAEYRGGKYQCIVNQSKLNEEMPQDWHATIVYQTPMAHMDLI